MKVKRVQPNQGSDLDRSLSIAIFTLIVIALATVSFAFTVEAFHPYDAIKRVAFHGFALAIGFLLLLRVVLTTVSPVRKNLLHWLVIAFLLYNIGSFLAFPFTDHAYLIDLALLVVFFLAVSSTVNSERRYLMVAHVVAVIVLTSGVYAIFQFFGHDLDPRLQYRFGERFVGQRVFSFFSNPTFFGDVLVLLLPLQLSALVVSSGKKKILFATTLGLAIPALILSGSRAPLLAVAVSFMTYFALVYGRCEKRRYLLVVSMASGLVLLGFLFIFFFRPLPSDLSPLGLERRHYWWGKAAEIAGDHPVFGAGVGTFKVHYPSYRSRSEEIALGEAQHEIRLEHAHNEYLEILSELGTFGLMLFLGIVVSYFYRIYRVWEPEKRFLLAGNTCAMVGILISSCFSVGLRVIFVAFFFWLVLGLVSGLTSENERSPKPHFSISKVGLCALVAPLLIWLFLNESWGAFAAEKEKLKGSVVFNSQDFKRAEYYFKRAVDNNPFAADLFYFLGVSQYRLRKLADAEQSFRRVLEINPNYLQTHYWLGNIYFGMRDYSRARKEYEKALELNDAYGPAFYGMGLVLLEGGEAEKALGYLEQAYTIPGDQTTQRTRLHALDKLMEIHRELENLDKVELYRGRKVELEKSMRESGT